jgi:hypothetical protein
LVSKACTGFSPNDPFLYASAGFSQIEWNSVFSHTYGHNIEATVPGSYKLYLVAYQVAYKKEIV